MISFLAGVIAAWVVLGADLRRRRISFAQFVSGKFLVVLDVISTTFSAGFLAGLFVLLVPDAITQRSISLDSPIPWTFAAGLVIFAFLWRAGRLQAQFQRPEGLVFAEWLILAGAFPLVEAAIFRLAQWSGAPSGAAIWILCLAAIMAGAATLAVIVPPFMKRYEGLRILEHVKERGETVQPEYTPPSTECPHPELWKMVDSQSTELEVIDFLKALVIAMKPKLIVETGTFLAYSTLKMAEALKENGFGKIITIEYDPDIFAKARERIDASGLASWIDNRNASSLETHVDGTIDLLFSDSHRTIRGKEIRRWLPQIETRGLILIHDTSPHYPVVRETVLELEREGLLSIVMLPTPRGLVIAQKREGRQ
ncbi:MAG: O-methyltransferase [Candidatus Acidiferrales bacterium]